MTTPTTSTPPSSNSTAGKTASDSTSLPKKDPNNATNGEYIETNKADMPAGETVESGESPDSKGTEKGGTEEGGAEKKDSGDKDSKKEDPRKEDPKKEDSKNKDPKKEDPEKDPKKEDSKKEAPKNEDPENTSQGKSLNDGKPHKSSGVSSMGFLKPPPNTGEKREADDDTKQHKPKRPRHNSSEARKLLVNLLNIENDEQRKDCLRELHKQNRSLFNELWKVHYGELSSEVVAQKQTSIRVLFNKHKMVEYWKKWGLEPPTIDRTYCLECEGREFSGGYLIVLTGEGMYCHVKCWEKYQEKGFDSQ